MIAMVGRLRQKMPTSSSGEVLVGYMSFLDPSSGSVRGGGDKVHRQDSRCHPETLWDHLPPGILMPFTSVHRHLLLAKGKKDRKYTRHCPHSALEFVRVKETSFPWKNVLIEIIKFADNEGSLSAWVIELTQSFSSDYGSSSWLSARGVGGGAAHNFAMAAAVTSLRIAGMLFAGRLAGGYHKIPILLRQAGDHLHGITYLSGPDGPT